MRALKKKEKNKQKKTRVKRISKIRVKSISKITLMASFLKVCLFLEK